MLRPLKSIKWSGSLFVLILLSFICFMYYVGIYLVWSQKMPQTTGSVLFLIFFHIILFLLLWSIFTSIFVDPGRVPLYWGFFLDDPEHKKRRYCLICHIFKPERCHHCSACNRCVLNMDHHCPWINNCVGFYNRKFFILMLGYSIFTTTLIAISLMLGLQQVLQNDVTNFHNLSDQVMLDDFLLLLALIFDITFIIVISFFFKFHIDLLFTNSTTIENLDKKRSNMSPGTANYDMGGYYNWVQVMGKNPWLWFLPLFLNTGKPVGDGVLWPQKQQQTSTQSN